VDLSNQEQEWLMMGSIYSPSVAVIKVLLGNIRFVIRFIKPYSIDQTFDMVLKLWLQSQSNANHNESMSFS